MHKGFLWRNPSKVFESGTTLSFLYLSSLVRGVFLHQGSKINTVHVAIFFSENGRNLWSQACLTLKKVKVSSERAETEEKDFVWESSYMTTKGGIRNV